MDSKNVRREVNLLSDYHERSIDDSLKRIAKSLETIVRIMKIDRAKESGLPLISRKLVDEEKEGEQRILSIVRNNEETEE